MGEHWGVQLPGTLLSTALQSLCSFRYAHVSPECLEGSPTNTWWQEWRSSGASKQHAEAVLEQHADYDGIAVVWGIGNFRQTAEDCAEACRTYAPHLHNGGQTTLKVLQHWHVLQFAK